MYKTLLLLLLSTTVVAAEPQYTRDDFLDQINELEITTMRLQQIEKDMMWAIKLNDIARVGALAASQHELVDTRAIQARTLIKMRIALNLKDGRSGKNP